MALSVLPQIGTNTAKSFVQHLINHKLIKPGFAQVLAGKYLDEVEQYLLKNHLISEEQLASEYAEFYRLPSVRLIDRQLRPEVARLIPEEVAKKYAVFVYDLKGFELSIAIGEPSKLQRNAPDVLTRLRHQKGLRVNLAIAPRHDVLAAIERVYSQAVSQAEPKAESATPSLPEKTIELKPTEVAKVKEEVAVPPTQPIKSEPTEEKTEKPVEPATKTTKELEPRLKNVDLTHREIPAEVLKKIPFDVAKKFKIVVFGEEEAKGKYEPALIKVAGTNPDNPKVREILSYIEERNKVLVDRYHTSEESFEAALKRYPEQGEKTVELQEEKPVAQKQPVATETALPAEKVIEDKPIVAPSLPSAAKAEETAVKKIEPRSEPTIQLPADENALTLTSTDIVNRPSAEASTEELKQLAREQELTIEGQNLDRLLKGPVTSVEELAKVFKGAVVPEIVAALLFLAIRMKASDVHVEASQDSVRFRYRIDGILHDIIRVPHFLHAPLVSRIKILSKMKIDEQRVPQDGRFDVTIDNRQVDLRVSTLPTVHGEKVVMRLLDKSGGVLTLEQLGITGTNFDRLVENINKPYGIILATGPTGSGKSTTLYAVLNRISKPGVNIITLEDPVEYELPGINQAQVKPQIGFTFAEGLRSVLRQDPNVIMVGEIRDLETAAMATHAALTGHLVLSTLHTNDASGALPRLINMGVEPFLITSSLNAVVGQRLVRKVCDKCKERASIPTAVMKFVEKQLEAIPTGKLKNLTPEQLVFYHGTGCDECTDGYKGRIGIYEVLTVNDEIESLAVAKAPASEIKKAAIKSGMITMTQDGLIKALKGITTVDEILRVTTTQIKEIPD